MPREADCLRSVFSVVLAKTGKLLEEKEFKLRLQEELRLVRRQENC